jgi:dTDP-4-amino-4,6-dideoxygalactose transaminase
MKCKYNAWPLGLLKKEFQRPELDLLKEKGYEFDDAREVTSIFEKKVAEYAGSKYAVAVDSCTNALFLALEYFKYIHRCTIDISIPSHTYISVPQSILHAGFGLKFDDREWSGPYKLEPLNIYDGAVRFTKGMYIQDSIQCLSFQIKKVLPIGKGGMILCNDKDAYDWFIKARYEGRDITKKYDEDILEFIGWNMYQIPEDSARGILLMDMLPEVNKDMADWTNYPSLSHQPVFGGK